MTKSYKKEERLSPQARKLIENTKNKYSLQPRKAIDYLLSVNPRKLNMYDRQKIGREILVRIYNARAPFFTTDQLDEIAKAYDVSPIEFKNFDRRKSHTESKKTDPTKDLKIRDRMSLLYGDPDKHLNQAELNEGYANGKLLPSALEGISDHKRNSPVEKQLDEKARARGSLPPYKSTLMGQALEDYIKAGKGYLAWGKFDAAYNAYANALRLRQAGYYAEGADGVNAILSEIESKIKSREDRKRNSGLEKATTTVAIVGVLAGLFFLSSNITGNAIANVSQNSSNILGAVLLVVGLVAGFFWIKNKK